MADDDFAPPPTRLMNFVSAEELDEARRSRGARVDDGTAQRDRSLYEILKENKDKKDAEFDERFRHRPPKALDHDETEFLDKLEMSRKEYERQMADDEAQQLSSFQAAVAAQSTIIQELKELPADPKVQEQKYVGRKHPLPRSLGMIIKVKPQAKKAKIDPEDSGESLDVEKTRNLDTEKSSGLKKTSNGDGEESHVTANTGLVSYSDESEEDN